MLGILFSISFIKFKLTNSVGYFIVLYHSFPISLMKSKLANSYGKLNFRQPLSPKYAKCCTWVGKGQG